MKRVPVPAFADSQLPPPTRPCHVSSSAEKVSSSMGKESRANRAGDSARLYQSWASHLATFPYRFARIKLIEVDAAASVCDGRVSAERR